MSKADSKGHRYQRDKKKLKVPFTGRLFSSSIGQNNQNMRSNNVKHTQTYTNLQDPSRRDAQAVNLGTPFKKGKLLAGCWPVYRDSQGSLQSHALSSFFVFLLHAFSCFFYPGETVVRLQRNPTQATNRMWHSQELSKRSLDAPVAKERIDNVWISSWWKSLCDVPASRHSMINIT